MGIAFGTFYHELVVKKDMPKLSAVYRARIRKAIEEKLVYNPEIFGKPLRSSLRGYRKLRVGDYRVIFRTEKDKVKIFYIGHRLAAYGETQKRFR